MADQQRQAAGGYRATTDRLNNLSTTVDPRSLQQVGQSPVSLTGIHQMRQHRVASHSDVVIHGLSALLWIAAAQSFQQQPMR